MYRRTKRLYAFIGIVCFTFSGFSIVRYLRYSDQKQKHFPFKVEGYNVVQTLPHLHEILAESQFNQAKLERINVFRENVYDVRAECVPLRINNTGVTPKVCIYNTTDDIYVSAALKTLGTWEDDILTAHALQLQAHPGAVFLDVGSHVGLFTIMATSLGHDTISIDPLRTNLQLLSKSLEQIAPSKKGNATLLWNAVSDKYETVRLRYNNKNIGSTHIQHSGEPHQIGTVRAAEYAINTILLDDLVDSFGIKSKTLFIKMDIEGSEYKALMGAYKLFERNNVCFVSMEIAVIKKKGVLSLVVDFMSKFGLQMFADANLVHLVDGNFKTIGADVFFSKSDCY